MDQLKLVNDRLKKIEEIVNDSSPGNAPEKWHVGVDLGTADIVVIVTDENGEPHSAFMEWAEVVRDGIVLDYWKATQIVKELLEKTERKLNIEIKSAITSYPPGTDPRTSKNVIEAAGLIVEGIIDEPSSVAHLLNMESGAVVDVGGGTTGIAIVRDKKIIYSADEPTGGRHATLTIAGNQGISFEKAEEMKRNGQAASLKPIVEPVFQKMADIVRKHLENYDTKDIYLSGGTFCFPGIDKVFIDELTGKNIILPYNPLYLTPLAIASYRVSGKETNG
ncbi:MAG: ethanolamine utilization protein EutJ [Calditrichaceae bacterium]